MYLESVNILLLEELFKKSDRHISELMSVSKLNRRQLLKAIEELNYFFHDNDFLNVIRVKDNHVSFENNSLNFNEIKKNLSLILQPDERAAFLYCYIYGNSNIAKNIDNLSEMLSVSRNTIINDLKFLRKQSKDFDIVYHQQDGYKIKGSELRARLYFLQCFSLLYNRSSSLIKTLYASLSMSNKSFFDINNMFQRIEYDIFSGHNNFCAEQLKGLMLLTTIHYNNGTFINKHLNLCNVPSKIEQSVRSFHTLHFNEQNFIIIVLATMNLQKIERPLYTKSNLLVSKAFITDFIRLTSCNFNHQKEVERVVASLIGKSITKNFYSINNRSMLPQSSHEIQKAMKVIVDLLLNEYLQMISNTTQKKLAEEISLIFINYLNLNEQSDIFDVAIFIPSSYEYSLSIALYLKQHLPNISVNILTKRQLANNKCDLLITTMNSGRLVSELNDKTLPLSLPFIPNYLEYIHKLVIKHEQEKNRDTLKHAAQFNFFNTADSNIQQIVNAFLKNTKNKVFIDFDYRELRIKNNRVRIYYFTSNGNHTKPQNTHYHLNNVSEHSVNHVFFINNRDCKNVLISIETVISNLRV